MTGGSVVAAVDSGCTTGDQLNLRMADFPKLVIEVSNFVIFKIELYVEVKEVNDLLWYQAQGSMNVDAAMKRKGIGVFIAYRVR